MAKIIVAIDDRPPIEFIKKYTVKKHWPFGHEIVFEEDSTLSWHSSVTDANKICAMLNGAYNVGRSDQRQDIVFSDNKIHNAVHDLIDATDIGCIGSWELKAKDQVLISERKFFNIQNKARVLSQLLGKEYRKWQRQT